MNFSVMEEMPALYTHTHISIDTIVAQQQHGHNTTLKVHRVIHTSKNKSVC